MNRREFLAGSAGAVLGALAAGAPGCAARSPGEMNLLLVTVEDWTARALGCYGNEVVKTPRVDAFAKGAVRFERAYCQSPGCNPSRSSFLTGLRPETTRIFGNRDPMDRLLPPEALSLPELVKTRGFRAVGIGKLFHEGFMARRQLGAFDRLELCDIPEGYAGVSTGYEPLPGEKPPPPRRFRFSPDPELERRLVALERERDEALRGTVPGSGEWQRALIPFRQLQAELLGDSGESEEGSLDGRRARLAARLVGELAREGRPFFLSLGLSAPHTPLVAPREYVDLYPPEAMPWPPAPRELDRDIPPIAIRFGANYDLFKSVPTPELVRKAIASYYACVSFADAQIGIVLDALEAAGLAESTAVVILADHGFHLGEHGLWSKVTLFEQAIRVPLLVRLPGAAGQGATCRQIVELVDLVPTVCDLWSIPAPQPLEGTSLAPLLQDPTRRWKRAAFAVCKQHASLGRSVRTRRYRWSEWRGPHGPQPELYDLQRDPFEQVNLAADPAHQAVARQLGSLLRAGWRAALPADVG